MEFTAEQIAGVIGGKGMNKECGLLVNSSRGIIYAANDETFAQTAAEKAKELMEQMDAELKKYGI